MGIWALYLWMVLGVFFGLTHHAHAENFTIENYNSILPYWGTSWLPGKSSINGYYPSFYTGFAPRVSDPARIHLRLARGNQTRVSIVLDEETLQNYLFDLVKRYRFYQRATSGSHPLVNVRPDEGTKNRVLPQLSYFQRIIESDTYGILPFTASGASPEAVHAKSLETLAALNPKRVFNLRIDLTPEFLRWKSRIRTMLSGVSDIPAYFTIKSSNTVIALNELLPGRVNVTLSPSGETLAQLATAAQLALNDSTPDDELVLALKKLFQIATHDRYDFALNCTSAAQCTLSYSEFTAIYPTGSVKDFTRDENGNSIPDFSTPGLWSFVSRGSREVDNIREESYYGWAPKMDYERAGNGFHNPAVRFTSLSRELKTQLNLPAQHGTFWSVKRGGVSHGCSRLPLGHIWEMRHLFPVVDKEMTQVNYFGSDPRDFDVYDIDGDGKPEVMGVEYLISYGLKEADGIGSREGTDLKIGRENKNAFYQTLYGTKDVFRQLDDGNFLFLSPTVSLPSYLDRLKKKVTARLSLQGDFPLYEQTYERDKVQFYLPITTDGLTTEGSQPLSKRIVRLMGRVRGCAPSIDKEKCGEASFDREAAKIIAESESSL